MLDDTLLPPPAPRPPVPRLPWPLRLRGWVATYLPLLLMALLALATWWLVRSAPDNDAPGPRRAPRHEPDYTMQGFTLQRFAADGRLRAQLEGSRLRHYPDTDTFEIDDVRVLAHGEDGSVTRAVAQRALSDGKGTVVELIGSAQVVAQGLQGREPVEFRSDYLKFLVEAQQVRTHLPVQVRQGRDVVRGAGLAYDHRSRSAQLQGPMTARLESPGQRR